jgi:ribulose bisphosphate carboxylase small subunit
VLATEYQEQARIRDLSWPSWRGCFVVFHVKPLDILAEFEPMLLFEWPGTSHVVM